MKRTIGLPGRLALYAALAVAMCLSIGPWGSNAAAQENSRTISGHTVAGRFLEVWSAHGSAAADIYVNGLPITDRRPEISLTDGNTYEVQWFERARYEAHPENKAPYDVLLGLLGVTLTEGRPTIDPTTGKPGDPADQAFVKIDKPAGADGKTKVWFPETGHSISGKILEYWKRYGGLQQFGFPLSEQFQEVSPTDGKTYTVQYFERNRFELHPEKAAPYEVELGLLGVQQYKTIPVAADQLPISPPKGVTSTKDTLVFAAPTEPASLISLGTAGNTTVLITQMMYNGTVVPDYKGRYWPGDVYYVPLVENGGAYFVGQGGDRHLVVKEKVRFGLKWSDGAPVTSSDWVFAYKLMKDPKSGLVANPRISSVVNPDAHTVIYNYLSYNQALALYNKPGQDQYLLDTLKPYVDAKVPVVEPEYFGADWGAPYPEHAVSKIPPDKLNDSEFARKPVGDGPFMVDHWDAGTQIVLVPNPNYTLTAPPLLKRIVVKFISDNKQVIDQLKSGDVDAAPYLGGPSGFAQLDPLTTSGQTVVYSPSPQFEHIDFNLDRPQFADKAVRQAMLYGINRQQIVDQLFGGHSQVLSTFVPPKIWDSMENPDFAAAWASKYPYNRYQYDPAKANQMLDAAGWAKGSDGIRAKNGVRLEFDYATTAGNKVREQVTQMVTADLKNLGMHANPKFIPGSTFFGDEGTLAKRQFDLAEYAWITLDEVAGDLYDSRYMPTPQNSYNGSDCPGWKNDRFDALWHGYDAEVEQAKRAPMAAEMQQIFNDELPTMPLYAGANAAAHKSNLMNWFDSGDNNLNTPSYMAAAMYFK